MKQKDASVKWLKEGLSAGDTLYTVLTHESKSGMSRSIKIYTFKNNAMIDITYNVASALGDKIDPKNGGVKVQGCGMDMGFHIVYDLSHHLFPEGFKVEGTGRNGDKSGWDNDGGYALKQRWL